MGDAQQGETRKLVVTSCKEKHRGTGKNGKEYVIYAVEATKEDGTAVPGPLQTFYDLTEHIGKPVDYQVQRYKSTSDKYPDSFTLSPPKRKLGEQVDVLRGRIEKLEQIVGELIRDDARFKSEPTPAETPAAQPAAGPSEFGDDPPF